MGLLLSSQFLSLKGANDNHKLSVFDFGETQVAEVRQMFSHTH
jgi:hypothetical protein